MKSDYMNEKPRALVYFFNWAIYAGALLYQRIFVSFSNVYANLNDRIRNFFSIPVILFLVVFAVVIWYECRICTINIRKYDQTEESQKTTSKYYNFHMFFNMIAPIVFGFFFHMF